MNIRPTRDSTAGKGMRLMPRDVALVTLVERHDALLRRQLARALTFGSTTRINAVLLRLVRFGYLNRRWQPTLSGTRRAVYILGPRGRELLGDVSKAERSRFAQVSDLFLEHRLVLNDIWLAFATCVANNYRLSRWLAEDELRNQKLGIVPDAYVEYEDAGQSFAAFVEADLGTETLKRWEIKTDAYLHLAFSGLFERLFTRRYFRVLVATTSPVRLARLRTTVARRTKQIFWFTTRDQLEQMGPLAAIWQRPLDDSLQSLTSS